MSSAPTPAPHTPILFARGGASMAWSAECVKALAECGYHPDDFGDYEHVRKRCRNAKNLVGRQNEYDQAPQPKPPPNAPNPGPTMHDRFLAESQSGHLTQDATQVRAGSRGAGNPCDNLVDGYDSAAAPCMPQHGNAQTFGTQHNRASVMESEQPYAGSSPPRENTPYPPGQLERDTQERTRAIVRHRCDPANNGPQPQTPAVAYGAANTPGYFGPNDPRNAPASASANATVISPSSSPEGRSPADVAAECIDNFRKNAEAAAKKPWLPAPPGQTEEQAFNAHIARLEAQRNAATAASASANAQGADQARAQLADRQRELENLTRRGDTPGSDGEMRNGELRRAQDARNTAIRTGARQETIDRNNARVQRAYDERERLRGEIDTLEDRISGADRAAERARGIDCEIAQARRIYNGQPSPEGPRVPPVNPFLGTNPVTGDDEADRVRRDVAQRRRQAEAAHRSSAPTETDL